jgi:hypothetical protein
MAIKTTQLILFRKLSLLRAARLRLGAGWVHRYRGLDAQFSPTDFCTDDTWTPSFSRLEKFLRDYGYVDPLDEMGALPHYVGLLEKACAADLAKSRKLQNPFEKETHGTLENLRGDPDNGLSLAAELSLLLGQEPAPVPLPRPIVARDQSDAISDAVLESASVSFNDVVSLRKAEKAYKMAKNRAARARKAAAKKTYAARKLKRLKEEAPTQKSLLS